MKIYRPVSYHLEFTSYPILFPIILNYITQQLLFNKILTKIQNLTSKYQLSGFSYRNKSHVTLFNADTYHTSIAPLGNIYDNNILQQLQIL